MTTMIDTFGGRLTVALVARKSKQWGMTNSVTHELIARGEGIDIAHAEPLVHEIAHAVQFGIPVSRDGMTTEIDRQFQAYKSKHMSDVAECTALAVERIVFDILGWPFGFDNVVDLAIEDFKTVMTPAQAKWYIDRAFVMPVNSRRAGHVIAELWALTGTGPRENAPGPLERLTALGG